MMKHPFVYNVWSHANDHFSDPFKEIFIRNLVDSVTDKLKTIPVEDFQRCYQKWEQCLHRCEAAQGNYFEADNIDICKKINTLVNKKSVSLLFCHTSYF